MLENNETPQEQETDIFKYNFQKMFEERERKRKYRNAGFTVGIPYLLCFVISFLWPRIYIVAAATLGFSSKTAIDFINTPGVNQLFQIFLSTIMFTIPFILAIIISGRTVSETVILSKPKKIDVFPYFLLGFSFCLFSNVAVSYAGRFFEDFGVNYSVDFGKNPEGIFGFLLAVISTCIVPAMIEEFAFRGVILGRLYEYGESFAIFTTALLFGVIHGNFEQMPFAFLVGVILGFIRVKTGTLWICILVHFSNNLFAVIMDYASDKMQSEMLNVVYVVFVMFALLTLVPAIFLCEKREGENAFSLERKENEIKEKEKYKLFFSSPVIIIAVALYFFEAFKYFI